MGWLHSLFRKAPAQAPGASADDWAAGDQAECIGDGSWFSLFGAVASGPRRGEVRTVSEAETSEVPLFGERVFLRFARYPGRAFTARCFRKVTPRAERIERAEPEFVELVRRRTVTAPAPAEAS